MVLARVFFVVFFNFVGVQSTSLPESEKHKISRMTKKKFFFVTVAMRECDRSPTSRYYDYGTFHRNNSVFRCLRVCHNDPISTNIDKSIKRFKLITY